MPWLVRSPVVAACRGCLKQVPGRMQCEELSKELRRVNADAAERAGCLEAELADLRRSSAADTSAMRTRHAEELRAVREGTLRERDTEVERARRDAAERVRRAEEDRDTAITRTAAAAAEEIQSVKARLERKVSRSTPLAPLGLLLVVARSHRAPTAAHMLV